MGCGQSRNVECDKNGTRISARDKTDVHPDKIENERTVLSTHSRTVNGIHNAKTHEPRTSCNEIDDDLTETSRTKCLTIIHFNDVYNIEPREKEPVGGAARFATKVASLKHLNPLTVFSGDALNPSLMSSITRGKQMIPVLNALNVNIAVYGNHDFDFGVDELIEFKNATNFPWLLSNVFDLMTKDQLAEGEVERIINWGGIKIGFIGLVEKEWLVTLATVDPEEVEYRDFVSEGTKLAKQLRQEGAEFVIALTHMRVPNDTRLAKESRGIDLILGGHDHHYEVKEVNGIKVIKSGTDFREFSVITVKFGEDNNYTVDVERIEVNSLVSEDPEVKAIVDIYLDGLKDSMEDVLGDIEVELEGRFAKIRTGETNLGNFVTDIVHHVTQADVTLLNSGTLRSDTLHPAGQFKMKDLVAILPMPDSMVTLSVTGEQIIEALENGVSQWPKHEGRFPQISGMCFAFDATAEPGKRVIVNSIKIGGKALQKDKQYKLCTKAYIAKGKDGYDVFAKAQVLVNEEEGPILPAIVQNHFVSVSILKGAKKSISGHRQNIVTRHGETLDALHDMEKTQARINPKVEGRIKIINETKDCDPPADAETTKSHEDSDTILGQIKSSDVQDLKEREENTPEVAIKTNCDNPEAVSERIAEVDNPKKEEKNMDLDPKHDSADSENVTEVTINGEVDIAEEENKYVNLEHEDDHAKADSESATEVRVNGEVDNAKEEKKNVDLEPDLATEDEYWDLWEAVKVDDIETTQECYVIGLFEKSLDSDNDFCTGCRNVSYYYRQQFFYGQPFKFKVEKLRNEKHIRLTRFQDNKTILHLGAERNAVKVVQFLLEEGKVDANVKDEILQGVPLHGAAEYGSVDAARTLLERGACINEQDLIGNTALHIACDHHQDEMKMFLVEQGADVSMTNSDSQTPAL